MIFRKVVSGGQTGVDQAALRAAKRVGLETGGWAPRGWKTIDGSAPWLAQYGLVEYRDPCARASVYAARTLANIRDSDATIRIARNWDSPGELCTLRGIQMYGKPHFDVSDGSDDVVLRLHQFIVNNHVVVLNVAGNSERTAVGIGALAEAFLVRVFERIRLAGNP